MAGFRLVPLREDFVAKFASSELACPRACDEGTTVP
jgi:hypothetical protein